MGVSEKIASLWARASLAMRAGLMFGGARDLYKVYGYKQVLDHEDYLIKYKRQGFARRVIHAPVDAIWSDPPEISGPVKTGWDELLKQHPIYYYLSKADIFCGLGHFSALLIGFDDGGALDQPVRPKAGMKVNYFQPYLEGSVSITKYEDNPRSARFGLPVIYEITPGEMSTRKVANQLALNRRPFKVHYSRILHLADNTLENPILGYSRLDPVYNTLDDLAKVTGGSAETYWLIANRGLHIDIDKEMELNEDDADDLSDEIQEYVHQMSRVIRTRGAKVNSLGSDSPDPKNTFDVLISELSAATRIPKRVLMGSEAGQLASQQDRANWAVYIAERITTFAEPIILKPFIEMLQGAGVLPEGTPEIKWPDAYKLNPLERAQTSAQMARSMSNAIRAIQTAQEMNVQAFTIEEVRNVVSFGKHQPVFGPDPVGKPIPKKPEEPQPEPFGGGFGG